MVGKEGENLMKGNACNNCAKGDFFVSSAILTAIVCALILAVPRIGTAQVLYSNIVGTVTDPSGAAVPGASVTVTQEETKLTRTVTTNSSGTYVAATLPAGTYDVKVTAKGFRSYLKNGIEVSYNSEARVDAKLQLGAVSQTVEVSGAAPLLQTTHADVHHDINAVQLENVPMAPGNNFEHLFQAIPGMNPPSSAHSIATNPSRALAFNSNGTSQLGNDIKIDGVSQWNIWVPENSAYIPSSDAVRTVSVSTNDYKINQGFAGGTSANVEIKSGTNQLHGDAYEYHYDNALQALEYFAPHNHITCSPKDIFNQFGGSVGGPIKKDKVFFFSNVELTREYLFAQSLATIASPAMIQGDLRGLTGMPGSVLGASGSNTDVVYDPATGNGDGTGRSQIFATNNAADASTYNALCNAGDPGSMLLGSGFMECPNVIPTSRISPAAAKLMALMPGQNLPSSSSYEPDNNFVSGNDVHFNRITTDDKLNWNATDKFTMFGHIGVLHYSTFNPQIFGAAGGPQASGYIGNEGQAWGHTITFSVTGNYVATPHFVVDVNGGMTRQTTNSEQLDIKKNEGLDVLGIPGTNGTRPFEGSWPQFNISGFSNLGTQHTFMPYYRNDPQFFWSADANWIRGNHTVRFGGAIEIQHLNQQQPEWSAGGTSWAAAGGFGFGSGPTQCKSSSTSSTASGANCFDTRLKSGKTSSSNNFNDFSTFLLGLDTGWGKNIMVPDYFHTDTKEYSLYVGDTWEATRKLTATLGVRWEYYPFPTRSGTPAGVERYDFSSGQVLNCGEGGNPIDCGVSVGYKYFSPRVGLAYRATDSFVIRAGYGMTYDPFNLIDDLRTNYPILIPLNEVTPNSLTAAGVLDTASLQNTPGGECAVYPAFCFGAGGTLPLGIAIPALPSLTNASNPIPGNVNLVTTGDKVTRGYIQSWNFTLQKSLPDGWVASAGYVATRTTNQLGLLDLNVENWTTPAGCAPGKCGGSASRPFYYNGSNSGICTSAASTALGCRTGGTTLVTPVGANHYDSLQATLTHRWANGFDMSLAYTWSKTINVAACNDEKSNCPYIATPAFYNLNHGLAAFDRPQNFEAMFVDQPPFGPNGRWFKTGVASKVLGGWQLTGLLTTVSNTPVGRMRASGSSLNASGNQQRPDRVCSSIGTPKVVGYGQDWFDTSCFSGVDTQRIGNSAYYVFHGPHLFNMDAAVFRTFKLSERFNLQFRAQAFNVTNTPAFSNPSDNCGSIPSGSTSGCNSSSFGQVRGTTNFARHGDDFREFEFNARISF
jgi:Carboxypeptidase regulatory-like domain/TonB dependent receptor-like, beta-barrel